MGAGRKTRRLTCSVRKYSLFLQLEVKEESLRSGGNKPIPHGRARRRYAGLVECSIKKIACRANFHLHGETVRWSKARDGRKRRARDIRPVRADTQLV
jgi:hypothetical protein